MKDGLVRADTLPLVFRALGAEALPRGTHVRVRAAVGIDELTLDVHATLLARLAVDGRGALAEAGDEDEAAARPLALQLAIDVDEQRPRPASRPRPTPRLTTWPCNA